MCVILICGRGFEPRQALQALCVLLSFAIFICSIFCVRYVLCIWAICPTDSFAPKTCKIKRRTSGLCGASLNLNMYRRHAWLGDIYEWDNWSNTKVTHLCCIPPEIIFCKRSNRQLEPPLPINFSCWTFRNSALAPNFSFETWFGKADMGSLVHSRECGKAAAVSVPSFEADPVAENWKCGSRRLNLPFLAL